MVRGRRGGYISKQVGGGAGCGGALCASGRPLSRHLLAHPHFLVASCLPACLQLGGYAFIGEGIPVGLGAAFQVGAGLGCGN
jgi:hypothetical protein